ncbi:MAG: hprA [Actinomycetia bacterium]|nr:hprA [Actinomycetes bacterium]
MASPATVVDVTFEVVLLDRLSRADLVAAVIEKRAPGLDVRVRVCAQVPSGPGIHALLAGPLTPMTAADLTGLPDLRIIAVTSSGSDHVPVAEAAAAGIWVTTSVGYSTEEVAESALAMGLDLLRGITRADRAVRNGKWNSIAGRGRRVAGSRWGLVGAGSIARSLARRLVALDVEVSAWDPRKDPVEINDAVRMVASLDDLLTSSDVISLHLPLTPERRGLIGARELALLPEGAYLVNVARGDLLDHAALGDALRAGHLGGAALDVFPVEPIPAGDPLRDLPRTVLTPHAAWYSPQSLILPFEWAAEAVADVLSGRRPDRVLAEPSPTVTR